MELNDRLIHQWARLFEESVDRSGNFEVKTITSKDFLKARAKEMLELILKSYEKNGGFKGFHTARELVKNTDLAKVVMDSANNILAMALYRTDLDGNKRFASATNSNNSDYKDAAKAIIKTDIQPFDNWYWAEVSGPIEKYFKQLNGNPIPNYLVPIILNKHPSDFDLKDDGMHYDREIGQDNEVLTKMMFGFKSQEIYDRVMKEIEDYPRFKLDVNKYMESVFTEEKTDLERAKYVIHRVYDFYYEWGFREMLPSWHRELLWARKIIEDSLQKDLDKNTKRTYEALLKRANTCFEEMPLLEGHQFRLENANL